MVQLNGFQERKVNISSKAIIIMIYDCDSAIIMINDCHSVMINDCNSVIIIMINNCVINDCVVG